MIAKKEGDLEMDPDWEYIAITTETRVYIAYLNV
jgi:hypothetical protein